MDTTIESTNSINSRQEFVAFLKDLIVDYEKNKDKWENKDLKSFLESLSNYTEDIEAFYSNTNQKIDANIASWKVFADIFMGARIYE